MSEHERRCGVRIDEQVKQLEERLAEVSKTTDEKTQALLPAVRSALSAYQSQMKQTLQSVDDAKSTELTQSAAGLRDVAMKSRTAAEALQEGMDFLLPVLPRQPRHTRHTKQHRCRDIRGDEADELPHQSGTWRDC